LKSTNAGKIYRHFSYSLRIIKHTDAFIDNQDDNGYIDVVILTVTSRGDYMRLSTRTTMAVHLLSAIIYFQNDYKVTSEFLASSINTNPVVVRRLIQRLKRSGLVKVARGTGGVSLSRKPEDISLLDVYHAVEDHELIFAYHDDPNPDCPVGSHIHDILDQRLIGAQRSMETQLEQCTLSDLHKDLIKLTGEQHDNT